MSQPKVKPIPDGYSSVTPYLIIRGAAKAIAFYKRAFDATEVFPPFVDPNGRIGHAELQIGNSRIMLADEHPEIGAYSPDKLGGSPVSLMVYLDDVDTTSKRALGAGATLVRAVETQFYGDRICQIDDPFGHSWTLATHVEDVSPEEMQKRSETAHKAKNKK